MRNHHKYTFKLCISFLFIRKSILMMNWWIKKKISLLYVPTKTWGIQRVPLKWKFTWSHIVINGKAPLSYWAQWKKWIESVISHSQHHSGQRGSYSWHLHTASVLHKPQCMFWSRFFPSSGSKNWGVKKLYLSHTVPQTGKGGSGEFISCLVS